MAEGFRGYPKNLLIAGLFLVAIISFAVIIAEEQGYTEDLVKSDKINFTGLEQQVTKTSEDANRWSDSFQSDNPLLDFGALILFSIWGIGKLMWGSVMIILNLYLNGLSGVIGVSPVVIGSITAVVIISLIFYFWRVIKAGE